MAIIIPVRIASGIAVMESTHRDPRGPQQERRVLLHHRPAARRLEGVRSVGLPRVDLQGLRLLRARSTARTVS